MVYRADFEKEKEESIREDERKALAQQLQRLVDNHHGEQCRSVIIVQFITALEKGESVKYADFAKKVSS